ERVAEDVGVRRKPEIFQSLAEAEFVSKVRQGRFAGGKSGKEAQRADSRRTSGEIHESGPHLKRHVALLASRWAFRQQLPFGAIGGRRGEFACPVRAVAAGRCIRRAVANGRCACPTTWRSASRRRPRMSSGRRTAC